MPAGENLGVEESTFCSTGFILGKKYIQTTPKWRSLFFLVLFASFHFRITPKCSNVHRRVHMNKSTHGEAPGISMKFIDLVGSVNPTWKIHIHMLVKLDSSSRKFSGWTFQKYVSYHHLLGCPWYLGSVDDNPCISRLDTSVKWVKWTTNWRSPTYDQ